MSGQESPLPPSSPSGHVKVCGLTRPADACLALELGASFLGLILTGKSPRHLPENQARELVSAVRREVGDDVRFIGVFVDEEPREIARLFEELSLFAIQKHGDVEELAKLVPPERIIPALAIRGGEDGARIEELARRHAAILADAFSSTQHGGTGKVFEHHLVQPFFGQARVFIAGGLKPENIGEIVGRLRSGGLPYAFDLSSGVEESPGVKSAEKLREFFKAYRESLAAPGEER